MLQVTMFTMIFLFSTLATNADEEKFTRAFRCPGGFVEYLEAKYEGKTLKELLSNAGANLDKEDQVMGPNGAGIIVRSTMNNLSTIEQIIDSSLNSLLKVNDPKLVKELLIKHSWDFGQIHLGRKPIGMINFNLNHTTKGGVNLRWAITKQSVLELRESSGELVFTAFLSRYDSENSMTLHLTTNSKLNLQVSSNRQNNDANEDRGQQELQEEQLKKLTGLKKLTAKTMIEYFGEPTNLDELGGDPFDDTPGSVEQPDKEDYQYNGPNGSLYFFEIKEGTYSAKDLEQVVISAVHRHHEYKLIWQSQERQRLQDK